jgi:perosamine synthetase
MVRLGKKSTAGSANSMSDNKFTRWNEAKLMSESDAIVMFRPHIPSDAATRVADCLSTRWIGQGPAVDRFEAEFASRFSPSLVPVSTNSGTSALHLAYLLAGLGPKDEVICPVFTCTATNLPLLYEGCRIVFADVDPATMNMSVDHVRELITERTRAIVCVHYAGLPCDLEGLSALAKTHGLTLIQDNAHALGAEYQGRPIGELCDFSMYSFQAIKHITTGDGGLLAVRDPELALKAKRLRWFGIDRAAKQGGVWENDITEIGYKYQMTDIAANLGLAGLADFSFVLGHRQALLRRYHEGLSGVAGLSLVGGGDLSGHAAWLMTVLADDRESLMAKLREHRIECGMVHYRNDMYSVFEDSRGLFPNMDAIEPRYLCLPLHTHVALDDVERIVDVVRSGW